MRWIVLSVFALAAGLSQLLWLNFAPLISLIEKRYAVSENDAGLLLLVFPLVYMILSIPSGMMIDRKGYRFTVGMGTILMAVFSCVRIFSRPGPGGFGILLISQIGIAVAQPFVVNGISKLVLDWFEKSQEALANGIGTMGMFLGMAIGMGATPPLVDRFGFEGAMAVFAAFSILVSVSFFAFVHPNRARANPDMATAFGWKEFRTLLRNPGLALVFVLAFLGLGFFNGLTTWIEPILAPNGIDSVQAGVVGAALILGGVVGAVVIPGLSDTFRRHKPFLVGSILIALLTVFPLCNGNRFSLLLVLGALQGFFFLPAFALLLAMCSELAGEKLAGAATGILMLMGNAGGVVVILAMEAVKSEASPNPFGPSVYLLFALLAGAFLCSLFVAETHPALKRG